MDIIVPRDTVLKAVGARHILHTLAELSMREEETRAFMAAYLRDFTSFCG